MDTGRPISVVHPVHLTKKLFVLSSVVGTYRCVYSNITRYSDSQSICCVIDKERLGSKKMKIKTIMHLPNYHFLCKFQEFCEARRNIGF